MNDEINIKKMPTEEILELMGEDLYDGLADEVVESVKELLSRQESPIDIMSNGLVAGMDIVGVDFRDGVIFVPEVLMAAKAMKAGMELLKPLLAATGAPKMGTLVIGTVKGDIHDIGQNLVSMMMEGAGFDVINLGINNSVEAFIEAIQEHNAELLGLSAMLTTTMTYMRKVIDGLDEKGLLKHGKEILIGSKYQSNTVFMFTTISLRMFWTLYQSLKTFIGCIRNGASY